MFVPLPQSKLEESCLARPLSPDFVVVFIIAMLATERKHKLAGSTAIFLRIGTPCLSSLIFVLKTQMAQVWQVPCISLKGFDGTAQGRGSALWEAKLCLEPVHLP
jgi:hypothetical protein